MCKGYRSNGSRDTWNAANPLIFATAAGIIASILFKWRRAHLGLMRKPSTGARTLVASERCDVIELEFAGARMRMRGQVDETVLITVLRALRRSA